MFGTCKLEGFPQFKCMPPGSKDKIRIIAPDSDEMRNKLVTNKVNFHWLVVTEENQENCLKNQDKKKNLESIWKVTASVGAIFD